MVFLSLSERPFDNELVEGTDATDCSPTDFNASLIQAKELSQKVLWSCLLFLFLFIFIFIFPSFFLGCWGGGGGGGGGGGIL